MIFTNLLHCRFTSSFFVCLGDRANHTSRRNTTGNILTTDTNEHKILDEMSLKERHQYIDRVLNVKVRSDIIVLSVECLQSPTELFERTKLLLVLIVPFLLLNVLLFYLDVQNC
jgi:hypothetical protein